MEIRTIKYFLTVARTGKISAAADELHMTQPPLSRSMQELENELGKKLFIRGKRNIVLTDEGKLFRKRAEEILFLLSKAKREITCSDAELLGDVYIGGGESQGMKLILKAIERLQHKRPKIHYHIFSGNAESVIDKLDNGLLDFGVIFGDTVLDKYNYLRLPWVDKWGVLMTKNNRLTEKEYIAVDDLQKAPLIISEQMLKYNELSGWLGFAIEQLNIVATYNLLHTAKQMVELGIGSAICFAGIIDTKNLVFKPLFPALNANMYLIWRKQQIFSPAAAEYLLTVQNILKNSN